MTTIFIGDSFRYRPVGQRVAISLKGDVSKNLQDYSTDANRKLVRAAFSETDFLRNTPPEAIEGMARYPEAMACKR